MKSRYIILCLLILLALSAGLSAVNVTVGTGNQQNRKPFDFFYRFSLFEAMYYPQEINTAGYIEAITYYNNFPNGAIPNLHIKLWIGTTDQPDLSSGWIPSNQLSMLFNDTITFPAGQNEITLTLNHPFLYTGGNLVIMTCSPGMNVVPVTPLNFYCQTIGINRARDFYSNSTSPDPANPPMSGTHLSLSGQFAKTTFHFTNSPVTTDLGITAFSGPNTMTLGTEYTHTVSVCNYGNSAQSAYNVSLYDWNNTILASGTAQQVSTGQTVTIPITWIPNAGEGYSSIYAKVTVAVDQNSFNDVSQVMNVVYLPDGNGDITPPGSVSARIPIDMGKKNSLYEVIIPASYLEYQNFSGNRLITALKFYNNFVQNIPGKPVKIWLGSTGQSDLSAGWIPSGQMLQVFDGNVDFPAGVNTISIDFQTPFFYTGGNIVMMVNRPLDTEFFNNDNQFTCYAGNPGIARNAVSNGPSFDPANPPAGSQYLTDVYPAVGFTYAFETLGSLNGIICNSHNQPIANAIVQMDAYGLTATTNALGAFFLPWIVAGTYQMTVSAPGYVSQSHTAIITPQQNIIVNLVLHSVNDLIITGRVVSSLNQGTGIADGTVELVGEITTAVETDSQGYFTIYDVLANNSYIIRAMHPAYMTYYGNVSVLVQNVDVGDLPLEIDATPVDNPISEAVTFMAGCYPNPFNNHTTISYEIKEPATTRIDIYNVKGQKVRVLVDEVAKSGNWSAVWNGTDNNGKLVCNGVYYFKMSSGKYTRTRKVILLK